MSKNITSYDFLVKYSLCFSLKYAKNKINCKILKLLLAIYIIFVTTIIFCVEKTHYYCRNKSTMMK